MFFRIVPVREIVVEPRRLGDVKLKLFGSEEATGIAEAAAGTAAAAGGPESSTSSSQSSQFSSPAPEST